MAQTPWAGVTVNAVVPGAVHDGQAFDQYVQVVTDDGAELELFDMAPMVGGGLAVGDKADVLVAVDAYAGLARTAGRATLVAARAPVVPAEDRGVRPEVGRCEWALLAFRDSTPVLVPRDVVDGVEVGAEVGWREARFMLLGCRMMP